MIKLKKLLKEWNDTSFKDLPKRWSKPVDIFREETLDGLTELERLEESSPVKIGSALPGTGGRRKEIEIVIDKRFGKWQIVYFNMVRKYVSGVGYSPDRSMNYDDIFKLSSSEKNTIKKIIKNPEDIAYMDDENVKPSDVIRAIR
jgi:hypothetical protein